MSRRGRLIGLAVALALLANGVVNHAMAGIGARKPVRVCEPVKTLPVCKPVMVCEPAKTLPVCKPVKTLPVCKPVKPLPLPEACKPVKACDRVVAHSKSVVLHERLARFVWRFKAHAAGYEVQQEASPPATSSTPPTPAPAPQPPTT
jgi:hypothetical protein